jgi:hypothetical protein
MRGNPVTWSDFYKSTRWQGLRKHQLKTEPLCSFVSRRGIVTAATVADHIESGPRSSPASRRTLANRVHKSTKREIEVHSYRSDIGLDGYPTDPNHPFNRVQ